MLGLGWTEMLVIGVVALIFIGPKDLPMVMNRVGKIVGQIQRMGREFQREINKSTGLDEVRNLRNSITAPLKQTADEIRREFNTMNKDGTQSPSGAIKPADPKVESVADEIRAKAGMAPAAKSADRLAAEYGFKSTDKPAAEVAAPPTDLAPLPVMTGPTPKPVKAVRKPATKKAKVATADATSVVTLETEAAPVVIKPAPRKRTAKPVAPVPNADSVPVKKPRAPRKKPAEPAGEN